MRRQHTFPVSSLKAAVFVITLLLTFFKTSAQLRPLYSQYMFNPLVTNPAYAGSDDALNVTLAARNQWSGLEGSPETFTFASHALIAGKQLGVGVSVINDRIGVHRNLSAQASLAYHLRVSGNSVLSFGMQSGIRHTKADYFSLDGNKNGDPRISNVMMSQSSFDLGAGIYFKGEKLDIGLSVPEILPLKWTVNDTTVLNFSSATVYLFSKYNITLNEFLSLVPSVFARYKSDETVCLDISAGLLIHRVLFAGVAWRKSESMAFLIRAGITPQLNIGYSYDLTTGSAAMISNGSHEVTVNYLFRFLKHNVANPR